MHPAKNTEMAPELMAKLKAVGAPRMTQDPVPFELPPDTLDTKSGEGGKKKGKGKGKAK
jgi:hypothetical protein